MRGMLVGNIGGSDDPPLVVAPIPKWTSRQIKTSEGGSPVAALLPFAPIVGNLLVGVAFYRRDGNAVNLPPVVMVRADGNPWTGLMSRQTNVGSSSFERGLYLYAQIVVDPNDRLLRVSTGQDCNGDPPDQLGEDCDVLRATVIELVPPGGPGSYVDPASLVITPAEGDNGPTLNGHVVQSADPWVLEPPFNTGYLVVGVSAWRVEGGTPMNALSWSPSLSGGGIVIASELHGLSINWGTRAGDETITPEATFAEGGNSGLSMAAMALAYGA